MSGTSARRPELPVPLAPQTTAGPVPAAGGLDGALLLAVIVVLTAVVVVATWLLYRCRTRATCAACPPNQGHPVARVEGGRPPPTQAT